MAVKNNPRVGTISCCHCDQTRSVHMTSKGKYAGFLYTRCPNCPGKKFDSPRDAVSQAVLRRDVIFDDGFEHLRSEVPKGSSSAAIGKEGGDKGSSSAAIGKEGDDKGSSSAAIGKEGDGKPGQRHNRLAIFGFTVIGICLMVVGVVK